MGDPYPGLIKFQGGKAWVLSYEAVVASLAIGGWPQSLWAKAAAVISAESNRTLNIYNTYLDGHYGLMQIGKQQHPDFFKVDTQWMVPFLNTAEGYSIYKSQGWGAWEAASNGRYTGSLLQAQAAVTSVKAKKAKTKLSDGDFYTSLYGKDEDAIMLLFAAPGLAAANKAIAQSVGGGANAIGDTIDSAGAAVIDTVGQMQSSSILGAVQLMIGAAKWLGDSANWLRIVQVVAGGGLLLAGVSIAAKPLTSGVAKTAASLTPVTRAIKKVAS